MNELLEWQKTALALRDQRISSRKICDALGWERSKKSTVNFFFTKHDNDSGFTPKKEITFDGNINNTKIKKFSDYEVELMVRKSIVETKENLKIVVIADTQCKSEEDLTYMGAIGKFIYNEKPDVIVHIGDHYDFPSLSSYDKGKSSSEGRRLSNDIKAGNEGFEKLNKYINSDASYNPRKVFCMGNHECLTPDAEVLTYNGFKNIGDVTTEDLVASMCGKYGLQWDKPKALIRKHYTGDLVKFNTRSFSFRGTEKHRMYFETSGGNIQESLAKDMTENFKVITALDSNCSIEMSDDLLRLSAWLCTDSHFTSSGKPILYQRESNAHKIRNLLEALNVEFTEKRRDRNITEVCGKMLKKPCEVGIEFHLKSNPTPVTNNETLPSFVRELSNQQWDVFLEILIEADGTIPTKAVNSRVFYGKKKICDSVQLEATLHGWSASLTEYRPNHWRVNLVKRNTRKQEAVKKSVESYDGMVYCLEMPLENFVIRQGNKVHVTGNCRLDRYVDEHPELIGTLGTEQLPFEKYGWEVHDFLKPVEIGGVFFVHYLANPMNGKPYGGNAMNILKTVGRSFVVGHKQCLDIAIRPTIDGKQQIGIINGACYPFDEKYKGYQGNNHFRGLTVLNSVSDGFGVPSFVSLGSISGKYGG